MPNKVVDYNKSYSGVSYNIYNEFCSTLEQTENKYWKKGCKHHPREKIPKQIWLITKGEAMTPKEFWAVYKDLYGDIPWGDQTGRPRGFRNYFMELVKQKLVV